MRSYRRGFTLVDAMITVAIVGVLAVLAVAGYRRMIRRTYMAEAGEMVAAIRSAQESFRAESGGYLSVSNGLGPQHDYPAATPGKFKTAWGGACNVCNNPATWNALNISSSAPLAFGYSSIASLPKDTGPPAGLTLTVNGSSLSLTGLGLPWYVVEADGDLDGNGVFTKVYGLSNDPKLYVDNEGE